MTPPRIVALAASGVLFVTASILIPLAFAAPQSLPKATRTERVYAASQPFEDRFQQLTSPSCGAASCHGGGAVGKKGSEQTTWAPDLLGKGPSDPHARAFQVLSNETSVRIAKALGYTHPASQEPLCLKCHSVPGAVGGNTSCEIGCTPTSSTSQPVPSEGVGCGGCHGPAEKWIGPHTLATWKTLSNREKWEQYGFVPGNDLVARNLTCVKCHIGDAEREVNHDLIAAGHPRLAFESARFHFHPTYRKHWTEKGNVADFELRTWFIGQIVGWRASAELVRVRAERAVRKQTPWPEFSSFGCFSCHKTVPADESAGLATRFESQKPRLGLAPWEEWSLANFAAVESLRGEVYPDAALPELKELLNLRALMETKSPKPREVAVQAAKAVTEIDGWLTAVQSARDSGKTATPSANLPRKLIHRIAELASLESDWDAFATAYLGCAAGYHAAGGKARAPSWSEPIRELETLLLFPKAKGKITYDSPADFGPTKAALIRKQFRALADATAESRSQP